MEDMEVGEKRKLRIAIREEPANKRSKERHEYPKSRGASSNRGPLAEAVVSGQRVSRLWNEAWKMWVLANCPRRERPPCDPARWEPEQLKMFFDDIGRCFLDGGQPIERFGPPGPPPPPLGFDAPFDIGRNGPMRRWQRDSPLMRNSGWGPPSWDREPPREMVRGGMPGGFRDRGMIRAPPRPRFAGRPSFGGSDSFVDPMLIKFVKEGQRNCPAFKEFYVEYCKDHGGGTYDPIKHDTPFFVGCALVYGVRKLADERWAKPYLGAVGLAGRPLLVRIIKRGQRNELRESWKNFCEKKGEGKFDPEHYDPQTLFEFVGSVGMETYNASEIMAKLTGG